MKHHTVIPAPEENVLVDASPTPRVEPVECEGLSFEDDELAELSDSCHGTATMLSYLGITVLSASILRLLGPALALHGAARRWLGEVR